MISESSFGISVSFSLSFSFGFSRLLALNDLRGTLPKWINKNRLYLYLYLCIQEERGYNGLPLFVCPSVRPSVRPPLTNSFGRIFLSNHSSDRLETWYGTSSRGLTCCLPISGPSVIYFLFPDLG